MARPKRPDTSVVVLETSVGEKLFIRSNPTDKDVRSYVEEQTRRHRAGALAGPGDTPAYKIFNATRYESEDGYFAGEEPVGEIDISKLVTP